MKAIVFDNAGTILERVTALKDMSNKNIIFETNTIGLVNQNEESLILVFQTPTKELISHEGKIIDYLTNNPDSFEISYSKKNYSKKEVLKALEKDTAEIADIKDSAIELKNKYDIEICSGSALIVNLKENKIDYVYTAGGVFFEDTIQLFKSLNKLNLPFYIASGDNRQSLLKIARILNVPLNRVYDTCNMDCKKKVVKSLQEKYDQVIMVGNNTNDYLAIKQADIGVLSIEQGEKLPEYLINASNFKISKIGQVLEILKEEV